MKSGVTEVRRDRAGHAGTTRRSFLAGSVAAVAITGAAGRAFSAERLPLTVAIGADLTSLDPHKLVSGLDHSFFSNCFESLLVNDQDGSLVPALAESVSVSEDGLVHTFRLRSGVKWHNGDPFTAEDVRFTWQRAIDPNLKNPRASVVAAKIKDVEIADPLTVKVVLKAPDASLHENLPTYFYIVPKKYIEEVGNDAFAAKPVGSGPFRFTERKPREYVKFAPFEGHWRGVPKTGEVSLKIVPDDQTRMAQIQTGESDIVTSVPLIFAARMKNASDFRIVRVPSFGNAFIVINNRGNNEDLKKPEVRRALNLAINREALARAITFGFATRHEAPCTPGMIGCDVKFDDPYRFDPQEAKKILTQAGFDFDRPLKIVGAATGRVTQSKETVEAVAQSLATAGVKTKIEILEYGTWATVAFAKQKDPTIDLYLLAAPDGNRDSGPRQVRTLHTGEAMSFYSDPELDAALEKLGKMRSEEEYAEQSREVFRTIHEQSALIPLWAYDSIYAIRNAVKYEPFRNVTWPILWYAEKSA
jgi:peptide/nickel transport system substrate-binding protein